VAPHAPHALPRHCCTLRCARSCGRLPLWPQDHSYTHAHTHTHTRTPVHPHSQAPAPLASDQPSAALPEGGGPGGVATGQGSALGRRAASATGLVVGAREGRLPCALVCAVTGVGAQPLSALRCTAPQQQAAPSAPQALGGCLLLCAPLSAQPARPRGLRLERASGAAAGGPLNLKTTDHAHASTRTPPKPTTAPAPAPALPPQQVDVCIPACCLTLALAPNRNPDPQPSPYSILHPDPHTHTHAHTRTRTHAHTHMHTHDPDPHPNPRQVDSRISVPLAMLKRDLGPHLAQLLPGGMRPSFEIPLRVQYRCVRWRGL